MTQPQRFSYHCLDELKEDISRRGLDLPTSDDFSILATPVRFGRLEVPNRFAVQPMEGCDGTGDGAPSDLTVRRYRRFAAGGAGLIWWEACAVVPEGRANPHQLWLHEATAEAFERMARLRPSLVVHTGDLLHPISPASYPSELPAIAELMARIEAPLGKYNVLGDTDGPIAEELRQGVGGFVTLVNEGVAIEKDGQRIRLFGLGNAESHDPHLARQKVERWLGSIEEGPFRIVVGHAPDFALTMTDLPVDLCLAGHTHGGQIRLPGVGPLITLSRVPRDWARGFRSIGTAALNVSAGIGTEHAEGLPPIRVYCPPEMTLLDLRPTG